MSKAVKISELVETERKRVNTPFQLLMNILYVILFIAVLYCLNTGHHKLAFWGGAIVAVVLMVITPPKWAFSNEFPKEPVTDAFLSKINGSSVPDELKGFAARAYADDRNLRFENLLALEKEYYLAEKRAAGKGFQSLAKHIKTE